MRKLVVCVAALLLWICFIVTSQAIAAPLKEMVTIEPLHNVGLVSVNVIAHDHFVVSYSLQQSDVYVELFKNNFHFTKENVGSKHKEGEGHIRLHINDEHVDTVYEAGFIIKGLPKGKHEIKIELAQNDRTPYEIDETFTVCIP